LNPSTISRDIPRRWSRTWINIMHQWNFESIHGVRRSRIGWKYLEKRKNLVGGSEAPVLGELISPKNPKIPRRNQEITNGGSCVTFMVVLERREVGNERDAEGVCSIQGVIPVKIR
jgi:hypothetical protein